MAKVLLIGMGPTALSAFMSLTEQVDVIGLVREADPNPTTVSPVIHAAQERGVAVYSQTTPAAITALVNELQPDCVVVSSYHRILQPALLATSRFVNVHYAPLPQYRGRATVNWTIINAEPHAAISIHTLVAGLDAGNILFQQCVPLHDDDTVGDVYATLNALQREHLGETVLRFLNGYEGLEQDEADSTYGCSRNPEDGAIDWNASTKTIYGLIRALVEPFPGAYTYFKGRQVMIWKAQPVVDPPHYVGRIPGRVVARSKREGSVDVLTGDGVLRLFEIQFSGEERTTAAQVITSVRDTLGLSLSSVLDRVAILEQQVAALMTVHDR